MGRTYEVSSLVVNTCTRAAEVALFADDKVLVQRSSDDIGSAEVLSVLLENVLAGKDFLSLSEIIYFSGPGSYTGLRVGAAFCQGLGCGLDLPCLSISTFLALSSTVDIFEGFLGLYIAASVTDVFYCEFKNSEQSTFWIPQFDFQVVEIANLEQFISERRKINNNYQHSEMILDSNTSSLMFEKGRLRASLDLWRSSLGVDSQRVNWHRHLSLDKGQDLLYMKAVAAKTLAERKIVQA